jgi:hypothetical protein
VTNITVSATFIQTTLSSTSWKVNDISNYSLTISPLPKVSYLKITLPSFISEQLTAKSSSTYSLLVNSVSYNAELVQTGNSGIF